VHGDSERTATERRRYNSPFNHASTVAASLCRGAFLYLRCLICARRKHGDPESVRDGYTNCRNVAASLCRGAFRIEHSPTAAAKLA